MVNVASLLPYLLPTDLAAIVARFFLMTTTLSNRETCPCGLQHLLLSIGRRHLHVVTLLNFYFFSVSVSSCLFSSGMDWHSFSNNIFILNGNVSDPKAPTCLTELTCTAGFSHFKGTKREDNWCRRESESTPCIVYIQNIKALYATV